MTEPGLSANFRLIPLSSLLAAVAFDAKVSNKTQYACEAAFSMDVPC